MLSVLVLGFQTVSGRAATAADSVRTLSALVPGTVEGVIRDVALISVGPNAELAKVADFAGCALTVGSSFSDGVRHGVDQARCAMVLVLPCGVTFDRALTDELAAAAAASTGSFALQSARSGLDRMLAWRMRPAGLLAPASALAASRATTLRGLERSLRPVKSFRTQAWSGD